MCSHHVAEEHHNHPQHEAEHDPEHNPHHPLPVASGLAHRLVRSAALNPMDMSTSQDAAAQLTACSSRPSSSSSSSSSRPSRHSRHSRRADSSHARVPIRRTCAGLGRRHSSSRVACSCAHRGPSLHRRQPTPRSLDRDFIVRTVRASPRAGGRARRGAYRWPR